MTDSKFRVGDKVYYPRVSRKIHTVLASDIDETYPLEVRCNSLTSDGKEFEDEIVPSIFHATQENYELLSKLHPNVEFEPPTQRKEPKEIIEAMLKAGHKYILCEVYCSGDYKDYYGTDSIIGIDESDGRFIGGTEENFWEQAIPITAKGQKIIDFVNGIVVLGD